MIFMCIETPLSFKPPLPLSFDEPLPLKSTKHSPEIPFKDLVFDEGAMLKGTLPDSTIGTQGTVDLLSLASLPLPEEIFWIAYEIDKKRFLVSAYGHFDLPLKPFASYKILSYPLSVSLHSEGMVEELVAGFERVVYQIRETFFNSVYQSTSTSSNLFKNQLHFCVLGKNLSRYLFFFKSRKDDFQSLLQTSSCTYKILAPPEIRCGRVLKVGEHNTPLYCVPHGYIESSLPVNWVGLSEDLSVVWVSLRRIPDCHSAKRLLKIFLDPMTDTITDPWTIVLDSWSFSDPSGTPKKIFRDAVLLLEKNLSALAFSRSSELFFCSLSQEIPPLQLESLEKCLIKELQFTEESDFPEEQPLPPPLPEASFLPPSASLPTTSAAPTALICLPANAGNFFCSKK